MRADWLSVRTPTCMNTWVSIEWADGDADPKWIELAIVDDGGGEADEFVELSLAAPFNAVIGAAAVTRINILDGTGVIQPPNAVAGPGQTVQSGATVRLNGAASSDPDADELSYSWSQTQGPAVSIDNALAASASFRAPTVSSDTFLQFRLQVVDPNGLSDVALTGVTVSAPDGDASTGGGGGALGVPLAVLLAGLLLARRRAIRTDAARRSSGFGPDRSK